MSGPDIQIEHAPAGQETLATIADEIAKEGEDLGAAMRRQASAPQIELSETTAGNATMAAIAEDVAKQAQVLAKSQGWASSVSIHDAELTEDEAPSGVRRAMQTLDYKKRDAGDKTSPEMITVEETVAGRATLNAIERDVRARRGEALEVFEMNTFVVRGGDLSALGSHQARRVFVAERLLHRLPVDSIDDVDRIDVTPWTTKGTLIVRVWSKVPG